MSGFSRIIGADRGSKERIIDSLALVIGDLLDYNRSAAKLVKATSSSTPESVAGVVASTTTSSDTVVNIQIPTEHDEYVVDSVNNSNVSHNYQRMLLTDENTVNNIGTDETADTAVVMQVGVRGAASDKKIVVEFITRMDRA